MSEVEKLYKLAGVGYLMYVVDTFPPVEYPQIDFTAEKQLNLITYLIKNEKLCIRKADNSDAFYMDTSNTRGDGVDNYNFTECLAGIVYLYLKQYDTPKFKQEEIRKILKG